MGFLFFNRRLQKAAFVLGMGVIFFLLLTVYLAAYSAKTESFAVDKTYYCVVRQTAAESVGVWSETAYLDGGAGYVVETDGDIFVALAAYERESQAKGVADALGRRGTACTILPLSIGTFYFTDRKRLAVYEQTKDCVFASLELAGLFYRLANGLSAGEYTQREAVSVLEESRKVLKTICKGCGGGETERMLRECERKCRAILSDTILSSDVRYMQLQLIGGIYALQKVFSI